MPKATIDHQGEGKRVALPWLSQYQKSKKADERRKHQFHKFYQMVIKKTGNANNIFIFGPGEAKLELAKEIKKIKGRHDRIAAVEVSDRLTENQIVAKMRSFFSVRGSGITIG